MSASILSTFLSLPLVASMLTAPVSHEDAERDWHPAYLSRAYGSAVRAERRKRYPWPVSLKSIGHSIASYQSYSGGLSGAYFHHGLDIRADAASPVIAAVGGKVINIENYMPGPAYWEVAILDEEGYIWQYHHVDRQSIPQAIHNAFKTGEPIAAGTKLGEVVYWSTVTFGERFHHIHLNVLGADKAYMNPFAFLEPLDDTQAPEVAEVGLLKDGGEVDAVTAGEDYSLFAEVSDLILHQKFIVPPNAISYAIDGGPPVLFWQFDGLPGGSSNSKHVNEFFVPSKTCGNYTCRKLTLDLGFRVGGKQKGLFPTDTGPHSVAIEVKDFAGNTTSRDYSWTVR